MRPCQIKGIIQENRAPLCPSLLRLSADVRCTNDCCELLEPYQRTRPYVIKEEAVAERAATTTSCECNASLFFTIIPVPFLNQSFILAFNTNVQSEIAWIRNGQKIILCGTFQNLYTLLFESFFGFVLKTIFAVTPCFFVFRTQSRPSTKGLATFADVRFPWCISKASIHLLCSSIDHFELFCFLSFSCCIFDDRYHNLSILYESIEQRLHFAFKINDILKFKFKSVFLLFLESQERERAFLFCRCCGRAAFRSFRSRSFGHKRRNERVTTLALLNRGVHLARHPLVNNMILLQSRVLRCSSQFLSERSSQRVSEH